MTFFTFLIAALVLAITPGPGMAYVVARTVAGGRKEGLASCLVCLGAWRSTRWPTSSRCWRRTACSSPLRVVLPGRVC